VLALAVVVMVSVHTLITAWHCTYNITAFCCPPSDQLPTCGWYTHNNGKCDQKCPDGTIDVGSNSMYCKKNYQAACCTTDTKSMKLYTTCEWGTYPMCNEQARCPGSDSSKKTLVAESSGGTGGGSCNMWAYGGPGSDVLELQQRKLCCDTATEKQKWGDCDWYTNIGFAPSGAPEKFCRSGCPSDRVRVAMDQWSTDCLVGGGGGGKSRCCIPSYNDTFEEENPKIEDYRFELKAYMDDPKCDNPGSILSFRASMNMTITNGTMAPFRTDSLTIEANSEGVKSANGILLLLVTKSTNQAMLEALEKVWDDTIGDKWSNLKISHLRDYLTGLPTYGSEGPIQLVHSVICSPNYWNNLAGKRSLICVDGICTETVMSVPGG
jgi:chitinase